MIQGQFGRALDRLGIPIVSVSFGTLGDRATWAIQYAPAATLQQRIDGDALRFTFDPADPAIVAADLTDQAQLTSRQKDILATCALIVRARGIAAWNGMTIAQKQAAVFAEADLWRDMRVWAETNL